MVPATSLTSVILFFHQVLVVKFLGYCLLYDVITCECDAVIVNFYSLEVGECYILKSNSILWIHPFLFQTFFTFIIIMGI